MDKSIILGRAKKAQMAHDFATAARLYKELLAEDQKNVDYLKALGGIYVQAREDEKAIPYYQKIVDYYPHYIEAMNNLGAIYRRLKRYDESIDILQRALDEDRQIPSVNYNLGFTYKEMGMYSDALEAFEMVIASNPDDVLAYNHMGVIYCALKEYDKSINAYKRGLQIDKNHPILNYNLAHTYEKKKNYAEAIRCYQTTVKTKPGWDEALHDYGLLLTNCQKNKEAQDIVQRAIKLHPNNPDLLCVLGKVYLNEFDYSTAEKTFKEANSLKKHDIDILSGLANAFEKNDKIEYALDTVQEALDYAPDNKDLKKQYAGTLLTSKDFEGAHKEIDQLYQEDQKDLQVLDLYGQYYICKDDEEAAQPFFDKIKRLDHHYKDFMLNAANRYSQNNNYEKASNYAQQYVESRPHNPEGYNMLGNISLKKGDLEAAKDFFDKSQNLRKPNALAAKQLKAINQKKQAIEEEAAEAAKAEIEAEKLREEMAAENQAAEEAARNVTQFENEQPLEAENGDFDFKSLGDDIAAEDEPVPEEAPVEETEEEVPEEEEEENPLFQQGPSLQDLAANDDTEDPFDMFDDDNKKDDDWVAPEPEDETEEPEEEVEESEPEQEMNPFEMMPSGNLSSGADSETAEETEETATEPVETVTKEAEPEEKVVEKPVEKEPEPEVEEPVEKELEPQKAEPEKSEDDFDDFDLFGDTNHADEPEEKPYKPVPSEPVPAQKPEMTDYERAANQQAMDSLKEANKTLQDALNAQKAASEAEKRALEAELAQQEEAAVDAIRNAISDQKEKNEDALAKALQEKEELEREKQEALERAAAAEEMAANNVEKPAQLSAEAMLNKIEKILNDDDFAQDNAEKIEMFKKLRALCLFLPEKEKKTFACTRMLMMIEYIIAKLSGKPGLLAVANSLVKSGALGEDFVPAELDEDFEVTNEVIKGVFKNLKNLSDSLEDKELSTLLVASADSILERIELEDQKSRIF